MITVNDPQGWFCALLPNASWNGLSTNYCPNVTGDDTVAHEWGHAYTEYTNDLIYQWQSGALNESYSDIWGETVDLINGRGLDAPGPLRSDGGCSTFTGGTPDVSYRWLIGEESSLGAIRDMWNPNCAGDPGSVTDPVYWCSTGDNGGVHINSGIPNHAFALMVDGGNFNGYSGGGIGLTKAVHIEWAASIMLANASNFADNADALDAACSSLIGQNLTDLTTGGPSGMMIDAGNCSEVSDIVDAVELRAAVPCDFDKLLELDEPALCEGFGSVQTARFDDFEGGSLPAGWTASSHDVANAGTFDNPGWSVVGSLPGGGPAGSSAAFVPDLDQGNCAADDESGALALDSPAIVLPAGAPPHVAFDHWVATEGGWDGGNLKVSVNGGAWAPVPGSAYSFNPYNGVLNDPPVNTNPLASEEAFTGTDEGSVDGSWGQSQVDLYGLAFPGDSVRLRFDFGVDGCFGLIGWYVDDVHVYTCSDEPLPICGDGLLNDPNEVCDDGNMDDGDGCSSSCQVEDGWVCADPMPSNPDGTNVVADGSFEGGVPNADWTAFSTFGGIAEFPLCGPGNGCPAASLANTGDWLVWIGGLAGGVTSSVDQPVTIPAAATDLTLYTLRGICDDVSDTLHVSLDGTDIGTIVCDGVDGGWVAQTFPVAPFNDGGSHTLLIGGTVGGTNGTHSNFFVEDVVLNDNTPTSATPSVCMRIVEDLACNAGAVEFTEGIAPSWTVVDNEGTGVVWTDIASSGIGGNFTGGTGDAPSANSDAFIFTEFDTELVSNSFSLENAAEASLDYLVNYQNLAALDFLDLDISTDGGANWSTLLSWNEDHPIGGLFAAPGEAVSVDLAAYLGESNVQVRWHYYDPNFGDWDWYAQVDNVALTCNLKPDCDGAVATPDLLWSPNHKFEAINVLVTDPDGDPVTVTIDSIFQDEKVKGPGKHHPDGLGIGTSTAEVRAERDGKGDGRVYHIGFTADDGRGGVCTGEVLVGVPHDQGGANDPVDGGPLYDSTTP
jgi:cysteine-rich repeat protein